MAGINSVTLVGRVGQDPDYRKFPNGGEVVEFSLATSETWRDKSSGERKEKTQWHRVKITNANVIKIANDYVKKGSLVGIEGTLEYRQWEKDGQKHTMAEVVVGMFSGKLSLLGSKDDSGGGSDSRGSSSRSDDRGTGRSSGGGQGGNSSGNFSRELDDEIPSRGSAWNSRSHQATIAMGSKRQAASLPEYVVWLNMKARCNNPNTPNYASYGGRGIAVCEEWDSNFMAFMNDVGPRPSALHSIERENNAKGYGPDNCRWATATEQANNRRSSVLVEAFGERRTVAEWAARSGIPKGTFWARLKAKWSPEAAITTKVGNNGKRKDNG